MDRHQGHQRPEQWISAEAIRIWRFLTRVLFTVVPVSGQLGTEFRRPAIQQKLLIYVYINAATQAYSCADVSAARAKLAIAKPTSAFFNAGPSFVPSPVTATTSRFELSLLSMIPLTKLYLSCGDDLASTRNLGQILSSSSCFTCVQEQIQN